MMRHMIVMLVLVALVSLLTSTSATAGNYYNGFVDSAGYTWQDGYWWKAGSAYTRVRVQRAYCANGCTTYRWVYEYRPVAAKKVVINPYEEGWRDKLLDIVKQRDAYEGSARASAREHNEFVEAVRVLGLEGNFRWNGYGYEMTYAQGYGGYGPGAAGDYGYSQPVAEQGATQYGYGSYKESVDIYSNLDAGALLNQVLRLREQSYQLESQATSEAHATIGDVLREAGKAVEINAKGRAAAEALKAANAQEHVRLLRELWTAQPRQHGSPAADELQGRLTQETALRAAQALSNQKCVSCHGPEKAAKGLDLSDLTKLTEPQVNAVLKRITHSDPSLRMPLSADSSPGEPLTAEEVAVFHMAAFGRVPAGVPPQQ